MENTRFAQGMEQLKAVDGKGGENVIKSLEDTAPDLGRFIVEFAFGDIYTRQGLSIKEREMITLSSLLTAGGCEPQLEVHIHGALNDPAVKQRYPGCILRRQTKILTFPLSADKMLHSGFKDAGQISSSSVRISARLSIAPCKNQVYSGLCN